MRILSRNCPELEKKFTSSSFGGGNTGIGCVASKQEPRKDDDSRARNDEYDRLLHRRKGMSGSEFAGIGVQFAVSIIVFAFLGIWLDRWLGTSPIFVLVMVLGGAGLGFWSMVRKAR